MISRRLVLAAAAGDRHKADVLWMKLEPRARARSVPPSGMIWAASALGKEDKIRYWIKEAVRRRDPVICFHGVLFLFDPLRELP